MGVFYECDWCGTEYETIWTIHNCYYFFKFNAFQKVNTVDCIFNNVLLCDKFVLLSVPAEVIDTNINWLLFAEIPLLFV